ncbi:uncharacterized protein VNE69_10006 [Vairimorpha necatrix]|uniref:Uncharacterized protein n=1 Tax=Vairimorpha necatrix TaxID=6039 RepID=A0AAX4JF58_9MICR
MNILNVFSVMVFSLAQEEDIISEFINTTLVENKQKQMQYVDLGPCEVNVMLNLKKSGILHVRRYIINCSPDLKRYERTIKISCENKTINDIVKIIEKSISEMKLSTSVPVIFQYFEEDLDRCINPNSFATVEDLVEKILRINEKNKKKRNKDQFYFHKIIKLESSTTNSASEKSSNNSPNYIIRHHFRQYLTPDMEKTDEEFWIILKINAGGRYYLLYLTMEDKKNCLKILENKKYDPNDPIMKEIKNLFGSYGNISTFKSLNKYLNNNTTEKNVVEEERHISFRSLEKKKDIGNLESLKSFKNFFGLDMAKIAIKSDWISESKEIDNKIRALYDMRNDEGVNMLYHLLEKHEKREFILRSVFKKGRTVFSISFANLLRSEEIINVDDLIFLFEGEEEDEKTKIIKTICENISKLSASGLFLFDIHLFLATERYINEKTKTEDEKDLFFENLRNIGNLIKSSNNTQECNGNEKNENFNLIEIMKEINQKVNENVETADINMNIIEKLNPVFSQEETKSIVCANPGRCQEFLTNEDIENTENNNAEPEKKANYEGSFLDEKRNQRNNR